MTGDSKKIEFGWQFLHYYGIFRIVIALILLLMPVFTKSQQSLYIPSLYQTLAISYLILACLLFFMSFVEHRFSIQSIIQPITDIILLSLLAYAGQQSTAGFALLMALVSIFALLLLRHRLALVFGISSALSLFLVHYLREQGFNELLISDLSIQIIGILAVSLLGNTLARRLTHYEVESQEQHHSIINMHNLNQQIIDKMNRGALVINHKQEIMFMNKTAWLGLGMPDSPIGKQLQHVSEDLNSQHLISTSTSFEGIVFRVNNSGPEYLPRFVALENNQDTLILLENYSNISKKVQQLKLASLGQLTASIAHEIRNPLSAINQASQLLNEFENNNQQAKDLMEIIHRQIKRINNIIENVQSVSKRKAAERQVLHLDRFIPNFIKEYQQGIKFNAELTCNDLPENMQVKFDQSQLKQILSNLFDNALRYSFINTNKHVVHISANHDIKLGQTYLDIIDEGVGVTLEEAKKIFEPFYTTNHDGTGLGLYISRELCESNRAQLDCIPIAFGGACFRITFDGNLND